ncbi:M56 family metallopeptidase [Dyella amyloliquefaciens]|uniref:M56 family metallopeptidase n=1 Tax=Dyella amyloliquefaciens TaxID=1770545 RepID=UPI00102EB652|nr:M56 family metallopeptidase [Dyella amyloliquefaciens]
MVSSHVFLDTLQLVGVTLLHFLWQGLLVGAFYAAVRAALPRGAARYRLGVAALLVLSICPVLTMAWVLRTSPPMPSHDAMLDPVVVAAGSLSESPASILDHVAGRFGITPWLTVVWLAGVLVLSVRVWRQWRGLQGLIANGVEDDGPMWRMLLRLTERFGMRRRISLIWSGTVDTPLLVGWFRPVIVLPLTMATGFPRSQLELILAHELAHLKRLDPLVNFYQVVLETLFFFHPVVHWISADVRNEREICCDQMALTLHGGNWRDLARALSALGTMQQAAPMMMAASGGVLLDRVHQMAADHGAMAVQPARPYSGALLALGMVATLVLGLALKREGMPDLMGPVPRVASLIVLPLAQSLQQAWHPANLRPTTAPLQRPVDAALDSPDESLLSLAYPSVAPSLAVPGALPLAIANLAPRRAAMLPAHIEETGISSPALTPLRIRKPVYPAGALERGVEGKVVIEFSLASDGSVQDMRVVSANPGGVFEQAALMAMRGWVYSVPPGHLLSERYRQVMAFSLDGGAGNTRSREIQARIGCQVVTGTHICRSPEEAARQDAVEGSSK